MYMTRTEWSNGEQCGRLYHASLVTDEALIDSGVRRQQTEHGQSAAGLVHQEVVAGHHHLAVLEPLDVARRPSSTVSDVTLEHDISLGAGRHRTVKRST